MANEEYLDKYRSIIPSYSKEIVDQVLTLGVPISLPLDQDYPDTQQKFVSEDPDAYIKMESSDYNNFVNNLHLDLTRLFASSNFSDRILTNLESLQKGELSDISGQVDGLEDRIEEFRFLRAAYNQGFTIVHHNTFGDLSSQETDDEFYVSNIPKAEIDSRDKVLRLPIVGDYNRLRTGDRVPGPTISISTSGDGDNKTVLQYGRPLQAFKNLKNISYAIDGSEDTYWGEVVLTDELIGVPMDIFTTQVSGGALCVFEIELSDVKTFSYLSIKPYCEYPIRIVGLYVSKNQNISIPLTVENGWFNTNGYVLEGESYNISEIFVNERLSDLYVYIKVSDNVQFVGRGNSFGGTLVLDNSIFVAPLTGIVEVIVKDGNRPVIMEQMNIRPVIIERTDIEHAGLVSSFRIDQPSAGVTFENITATCSVAVSGYVRAETEGSFTYILKDFSNEEFYVDKTTRVNFPRQDGVGRIIFLLQQPHYTKETFLLSSEQHARYNIWQQMLGNFSILSQLPIAGLNGLSDTAVVLRDLRTLNKSPIPLQYIEKTMVSNKYQYVYGIYDIGLRHRIYGPIGVFVSKAYKTNKNLTQVALLVDEVNTVNEWDAQHAGTIEYDVTYGDGTDWYPIAPLNRRYIQEYFTTTGGSTANPPTRFPVSEIYSVSMFNEKHGLVTYVPTTGSRFVDLHRIEETFIKPLRTTERITVGTDRYNSIELARAPHINIGRVYSGFDPNGSTNNGDYVPINVSISNIDLEYIDPITENISNVRSVEQDQSKGKTRKVIRATTTHTVPVSSIVVRIDNYSIFRPKDIIDIYEPNGSKRERGTVKEVLLDALVLSNNTIESYGVGATVERVGSSYISAPYVKNITDYAGGALQSLTPYNSRTYPVVEYLHLNNKLFFNVSIKEGTEVSTSYDKLADEVRVRAIFKRYDTIDNATTPILKSYTLLLRDSQDTSHEDRLGSGVVWGGLYTIPLPITIDKLTGQIWRWYRIVNSGNSSDSVKVVINEFSEVLTPSGSANDTLVNPMTLGSTYATFEEVMGLKSIKTILYSSGVVDRVLDEWPYHIITRIGDNEIDEFYNKLIELGFSSMDSIALIVGEAEVLPTIKATVNMRGIAHSVSQYTGSTRYNGNLRQMLNALNDRAKMTPVIKFSATSDWPLQIGNDLPVLFTNETNAAFNTIKSQLGGFYNSKHLDMYVTIYNNNIITFGTTDLRYPIYYRTITSAEVASVYSYIIGQGFLQLGSTGAKENNTSITAFVNYGGVNKTTVVRFDTASSNDENQYLPQLPLWFRNIFNRMYEVAANGSPYETTSSYTVIDGSLVSSTSQQLVGVLNEGTGVLISNSSKRYDGTDLSLGDLISNTGRTYTYNSSNTIISGAITTPYSTFEVSIQGTGSAAMTYVGPATSYRKTRVLLSAEINKILTFMDNIGMWGMSNTHMQAGDLTNMPTYTLTTTLVNSQKDIAQYAGHIRGGYNTNPPFFDDRIIDIFNMIYYYLKSGTSSSEGLPSDPLLIRISNYLTGSNIDNMSVYRDIDDDCYIETLTTEASGVVLDDQLLGKTYEIITDGDTVVLQTGEHRLLGIPGNNIARVELVSAHPYNYLYDYNITGLVPLTSSNTASAYYAPFARIP